MVKSCGSAHHCINSNGYPDHVCPDFRIKRYDTRPSFEVVVKDCNWPINLTDTVLEASMWSKARLKAVVGQDDTYFQVADNIGFGQCLAGDIIVVGGNPRTPEQMFVIGFDEVNDLIQVQRGHNGTPQYSYKKGTPLKLFRVLNSTGSTEMHLLDVEHEGGDLERDVVTQSKLIYEWQPQDTCLPGCYYLELKLLKMAVSGNEGISSPSWYGDWHSRRRESEPAPMAFPPESDSNMYDPPGPPWSLLGPTWVPSNISPSLSIPSYTPPSFIDTSNTTLDCGPIPNVEWVRRFPVSAEGYLIEIVDSPTSEMVVAT